MCVDLNKLVRGPFSEVPRGAEHWNMAPRFIKLRIATCFRKTGRRERVTLSGRYKGEVQTDVRPSLLVWYVPAKPVPAE